MAWALVPCAGAAFVFAGFLHMGRPRSCQQTRTPARLMSPLAPFNGSRCSNSQLLWEIELGEAQPGQYFRRALLNFDSSTLGSGFRFTIQSRKHVGA